MSVHDEGYSRHRAHLIRYQRFYWTKYD